MFEGFSFSFERTQKMMVLYLWIQIWFSHEWQNMLSPKKLEVNKILSTNTDNHSPSKITFILRGKYPTQTYYTSIKALLSKGWHQWWRKEDQNLKNVLVLSVFEKIPGSICNVCHCIPATNIESGTTSMLRLRKMGFVTTMKSRFYSIDEASWKKRH